MAFRIPRLPSKDAIVSKNGWPVQSFQQWWQKVAVGIETAIRTLEGVLDNLTDIFVELGLIEVKADGALALADSAINPDGTIKTNRVVTDSIEPSAVTVNGMATPGDVYCPASTPTTFIETPFTTIGEGVSGQGMVSIDFTVTATDHDCSARLSFYVDTGSGWELARRRVMGVTTDNGDSWWVLPGAFRFAVTGTQVRVRGVCEPGVWMPSAQDRDLYVNDIIYAVFGGKR